METKKLTEAAIMSALFVVCSIFAVTTGLLYSFYLDMIVPIFIAIIYLRCDMKYTVLAIITCLVIIGLVIGDIGSAIWMSQSMLIGLMCGFIIPRKTKFLDDVFCLSIFTCFIMVLIDIYCSKLIGFSFMKDTRVMMNSWDISNQAKDIMLYILIAALPLGTVIITYIGSLFIGNRLKCLRGYGKDKFYILKNIRTYGSRICCSKKLIFIALLYLLIIEIKEYANIEINQAYILTITETIKYIIYYFVIRDAYAYIRIYVYQKTKSILALNLMGILFLLSLIIKFNMSFWIISIVAFIYIPVKFNK